MKETYELRSEPANTIYNSEYFRKSDSGVNLRKELKKSHPFGGWLLMFNLIYSLSGEQ